MSRPQRRELSRQTTQGICQHRLLLNEQGSSRMQRQDTYDGALNAAIFLKFLRRLIKDTDRKLFVMGQDGDSVG